MKRALGWFTPTRLAPITTAVVFAAAFVVSFDALMSLARAAGIREELTPAYPLLVDALMATGTVAAVALRSAPLRTRLYTWALIVAGIAVSVMGNAVHSQSHETLPWWAAAAASAVPALSLAASLHLLVIVLRHTRQDAPADAHEDAHVEVADTHVAAVHEEAPNGRQAARRGARPGAHSTSTTRARVEAMVRRAEKRGRELDVRTVAKRLQVSDGHARRLLTEARKVRGVEQLAPVTA